MAETQATSAMRRGTPGRAVRRTANATPRDASETFRSTSVMAPEITRGQENAVRAWLHGMGFDVAKVSGQSTTCHFLDDVFRNGVLLCALAQTVEPIKERLRVFRAPKTLQQARDNTMRALQRLQQLKQARIPPNYLADADCK